MGDDAPARPRARRSSEASHGSVTEILRRHSVPVPDVVANKISVWEDAVIEAREIKTLSDLGGLSYLQRKFASLLDHKSFDSVMGLVICSNLVIMAWDAEVSAACEEDQCINGLLVAVNTTYLLIYTLEATMRLYVLRCRFFLISWNLLDTVIVLTGWLDMLILVGSTGVQFPKLNALRIFRILRLARAIRLASVFPELYSMLQGFKSAMMAMFWGFVMIFVLLLIFSIMAVELVYPIQIELASDDHACNDAFVTVPNAVIYFFQTLVAGDSWGMCAIPLIKTSPMVCGTLFASALVSIQLGFTNLILAVIVETAAAAREADVEQQARNREREHKETTLKLQEIVNRMDTDGSGTITVNELLNGYDEMPELSQLLTMLDISKDDLIGMFTFMDHDASGDLSPGEFIRSIQRAQTQDFRVQMMVMRLQVSKLVECMQEAQEGISELLGKDPYAIADEVPEHLRKFSPSARRTIRVAEKNLAKSTQSRLATRTQSEETSSEACHSPGPVNGKVPKLHSEATVQQLKQEARRKMEAHNDHLQEQIANLIKEQTHKMMDLLPDFGRLEPWPSNGAIATIEVDNEDCAPFYQVATSFTSPPGFQVDSKHRPDGPAGATGQDCRPSSPSAANSRTRDPLALAGVKRSPVVI